MIFQEFLIIWSIFIKLKMTLTFMTFMIDFFEFHKSHKSQSKMSDKKVIPTLQQMNISTGLNS